MFDKIVVNGQQEHKQKSMQNTLKVQLVQENNLTEKRKVHKREGCLRSGYSCVWVCGWVDVGVGVKERDVYIYIYMYMYVYIYIDMM